MVAVPSPFHGIFSAFQAEHDAPAGAGAQSLSIEEEGETVATKGASTRQVGQIAMDVYEQDNYYVIRAPIAGVKLSDIDIEIDGKVVTIRGRREAPETIPDQQYFAQECFWGEFSRSVTLPTVADPKRVRATFSKDSILKVIIPKEEKVKIIRISEGA